jgi:hypothetical protein
LIEASLATALISSAHGCGHNENNKHDSHGDHDYHDCCIAHSVPFHPGSETPVPGRYGTLTADLCIYTARDH